MNPDLDLLRPDNRLHVGLGSFAETDWGKPDVDAAVLLETIEHIDPGRLPYPVDPVRGSSTQMACFKKRTQ